jgi:hypothetical protein
MCVQLDQCGAAVSIRQDILILQLRASLTFNVKLTYDGFKLEQAFDRGHLEQQHIQLCCLDPCSDLNKWGRKLWLLCK